MPSALVKARSGIGLRPRRADERPKGRRRRGGLVLRGRGVYAAHTGAAFRDHERDKKAGASGGHAKPCVKNQIRDGEAASGNSLPGLDHPFHAAKLPLRLARVKRNLYRRVADNAATGR